MRLVEEIRYKPSLDDVAKGRKVSQREALWGIASDCALPLHVIRSHEDCSINDVFVRGNKTTGRQSALRLLLPIE